MNTFNQIFVGGLLRLVQGLFSAAPTLIVGLLIATVLRFYLGREGTRKLFGGDSIRRLPQSWLIGMLLPVCSIGVLPILREMRRFGIKPGAMAAFALSAPLFNPLSLLYGLTLSRPLVIIMFAVGSLLIVTFLGMIWDAAVKNESTHSISEIDTDPSSDVIGLHRLRATVIHLGRQATGVTLLLAMIALSGLAFLAAVLPFGSMQTSVEQGDLWAPLTMTAVSIPIYATPMLAMSQLGMMFQHGNSPGAAFALMILGTGVNFATIAWFLYHFGWKPTAMWSAAMLAIVLGFAYGINQPLIPPGIQPAGHTHAFDIYTNPISAHTENFWRTSKEVLSKNIGFPEIAAGIGLAMISLFGLIARGLNLSPEKTSFIQPTPTNRIHSRLEMVVPRGVLGLVLIAGLVSLSIVACFAYYPPADECLDEIALARAECLSASMSGDVDHALFWLPVWEDWSRKLEVGTFLRSGPLRPYQQMQGYLIRKKLELLEHELEHDEVEQEEVMELVHHLMATNRRWVTSFQ
ncbi:permease [Stieleria sp. JC731]|uniref:permease n=1 Tax=Pirellulaceae TaxID=2691357 RepID=UPI001E41132B|nr:permease [Stieleria sp. JC731]MCC9602348.1 permease [Stieleria sp. JC731]